MIILFCKYCWFLTNYYLYRRNPRVLYSRSILRSMPITGYVSCMLRKQKIKNQKRILWRGGKRFFLDGQNSDDEYISAISFITPIRVVTSVLMSNTEKNNVYGNGSLLRVVKSQDCLVKS